MLYLHCNELVAGKVLDISGRGNNGTLGPNFPADAPTLIDSLNTRVSKGLSYNGSSNYVLISSALTWTPIPAFSIEAIVKFNNITDEAEIIGNSWDFRFSRSYSRIYSRVEVGTVAKETKSNAGVFAAGAFYLVHVTYGEDNYCHLYVNGAEISYAQQDDVGAGAVDSPPGDWALGLLYPGISSQLNGIIDEVCMYNRALSAAEILTRYKFAIAKV